MSLDAMFAIWVNINVFELCLKARKRRKCGNKRNVYI